MYLREIALMARRPLSREDRKIENMSRVFCALIAKVLRRRVKTRSVWKISVRFNDPEKSDDGRVLLGVLITHRELSVSNFLALDRHGREEAMLRFIDDALSQVFVNQGWDQTLVTAASRYVADHGFSNLIVGDLRFLSDDGSKEAYIECEQEIDEARVYVVVRKDNSMQRHLVATTPPDEFVFDKYFGRVEWDKKGQLLLKCVDGSIIKVPPT